MLNSEGSVSSAMQKNYETIRKNSKKFSDSYSDTEIEVRKGSQDDFLNKFEEDFRARCAIGDGLRQQSRPLVAESPRRFKQISLKDEVKIDLHKYVPCSTPSVRSACKIYPIEEVSEDPSRISIKSREKLSRRQMEVQRILEERRRQPRERPKSRNARKKSSGNVYDQLNTFYPSEESVVDSTFAECYKSGFDHQDMFTDRFRSSTSQFGSLASFKRAQIHRLSNDIIELHNHRQNRSNSVSDLMTVKTYSSTQTTPTSCFGCFLKPISKLCKKNSKKN